MITTVTVTTITIIAASSLIAAIGIFGTILLIGLLTGREILHAGTGSRQKLLARSLMVGIIPLLIGFLVIVALKVAEILA
ncbi:MAG: hypothetical protein ABSA18_14960 [Dehalococcoidia bacterium]|jgi:hypothetical protein